MKLENIMKEWEEDAPIDNQNLDGESIKIPNQKRWDAVIAQKGKRPEHDIRLSKSEREKYYVAADSELQEFEALINDQEDKVDYLSGVLDNIKNRNWQIKNAIDWSKFQVGLG